MIKVITYGTYDLLHPGHTRLLQRAKALGDWLMVGLSTDAFNEKKGKQAVMTFSERREVLESVRWVDAIIPECDWEQKIQDIKDNQIDIFVMGDDWAGKFDFLQPYCKVVYLPRTDFISTTLIKDRVYALH